VAHGYSGSILRVVARCRISFPCRRSHRTVLSPSGTRRQTEHGEPRLFGHGIRQCNLLSRHQDNEAGSNGTGYPRYCHTSPVGSRCPPRATLHASIQPSCAMRRTPGRHRLQKDTEYSKAIVLSSPRSSKRSRNVTVIIPRAFPDDCLLPRTRGS